VQFAGDTAGKLGIVRRNGNGSRQAFSHFAGKAGAGQHAAGMIGGNSSATT
jgi:hypothetical protein